jgi:hypothetical protein
VPHDVHEIARDVTACAVPRDAASGSVETVEPGADVS